MAKQSFSVGQVLTAAQMTSLQATAMGGGSPSVKTASYTLVAADAGTVIQVNSTSATTITVNTGLFAAGDSVQIQNIGSGTTTITSGTATVNSAGSLGVTQYDGGFLYFSSASSAIWFDYTQAGTTLPLTTKGDLFGYSTTNARIPVGADATVLTADSTQALGVKWAAAGGADPNYTLLNSGGTSLSGSTTTITFTAYNSLLIAIENISTDAANSVIDIRLNSDSANNYGAGSWYMVSGNGSYQQEDQNASRIRLLRCNAAVSSDNRGYIQIWGAKTSGQKPFNLVGTGQPGSPNNGRSYVSVGRYVGSSAITSVSIIADAGSFDSGTVYIYGSN